VQGTEAQPLIFLLTIYGGIALGVVFEAYRALRKAARKRRFIAPVYDTLFIAVMGALAVTVLYFTNMGELRLFTIVGFILGFALYLSGISPLVMLIIRRIRSRKRIRTGRKERSK